jgi:hypothetical protein
MPATMPPPEAPKRRPRSTDGRLLGIPAAARYLGVSAFTLRRLVRLGAVPLVKLPGVASWYVDHADLDGLVSTGKRTKGPSA